MVSKSANYCFANSSNPIVRLREIFAASLCEAGLDDWISPCN